MTDRNSGENGLREFNKTLELLLSLVQSSLKDLNEAGKNLSSLQTENRNLLSNFSELSSTIKEDRESFNEISVKVAKLEARCEAMDRSVLKAKAIVEDKDKSKADIVHSASVTGKWQFIVSTTTAVIALITTLLMHFLK